MCRWKPADTTCYLLLTDDSRCWIQHISHRPVDTRECSHSCLQWLWQRSQEPALQQMGCEEQLGSIPSRPSLPRGRTSSAAFPHYCSPKNGARAGGDAAPGTHRGKKPPHSPSLRQERSHSTRLSWKTQVAAAKCVCHTRPSKAIATLVGQQLTGITLVTAWQAQLQGCWVSVLLSARFAEANIASSRGASACRDL